MLYGWYKLVVGIREQKYARPTYIHLPAALNPGNTFTRTDIHIYSRPSASRILTDTPSSELAREKMWSRIHLIPLLQAEEDRDLVRRHLADQAREKELLGANTKVYHSDR